MDIKVKGSKEGRKTRRKEGRSDQEGVEAQRRFPQKRVRVKLSGNKRQRKKVALMTADTGFSGGPCRSNKNLEMKDG